MPYSAKANRTFRAIEHGWKPDDPKLQHLDRATAARLASEGVKRVKGGSK